MQRLRTIYFSKNNIPFAPSKHIGCMLIAYISLCATNANSGAWEYIFYADQVRAPECIVYGRLYILMKRAGLHGINKSPVNIKKFIRSRTKHIKYGAVCLHLGLGSTTNFQSVNAAGFSLFFAIVMRIDVAFPTLKCHVPQN